MRIEFTSDELILTLMGLIQATHPDMLRQGPDGFSVDFRAVEDKPAQELNSDEQLLLKFRDALESPAEASQYGLELKAADGLRLVETLERLESLHTWPPDVLTMSRNLRARLGAA